MKYALLVFVAALVVVIAIGEYRTRAAGKRGGPFYKFKHRWIEWFLGAASLTWGGTILTADNILHRSEHAHEMIHWQEEQRKGFTRHKWDWVTSAVFLFLKYGLARDRIVAVTADHKSKTFRRYRWYGHLKEERAAEENEKNAHLYSPIKVQ